MTKICHSHGQASNTVSLIRPIDTDNTFEWNIVFMGKLTIFILLLLLLGLGGGAVFLATWEIPAPVSNVEKVLPNDKFPR